jgi:alkylhydroperoxidase/carboxymuconolactone decarboxylase family protein YurZ
MSEQNPYFVELHDAFPALDAAQSAWMSQIDSLTSPDRKTHELVRLACTVILRNGPGVERHAKRAAEVGATWEEIAGTVVLTQPGFGLLPAVEAMPHARAGFESAEPAETDD